MRGALRLEMGEPGASLASDWSARDRDRDRVLRRDLARLPENERRRADERLDRVPSVVVDSLSDEEEEEEDDEEDEPVEELSESELDDELEPSPKKARRRAMVRPRPEPELEELEELEEEDDEEEEEEEEVLELLELALLRAELRLPRLLREPRRDRERNAREPVPRRPRVVLLR